MIALLKSLQEKWNNWCGDHEMEQEIRKHLSKNGYYGTSVKLKNVRLVAVERPGWLQVFRFEATARLQLEETDGPDPEATYDELFGLVREDIRHNMTDVRVFQDQAERRELFLRWGKDLIQLRGAQGLA